MKKSLEESEKAGGREVNKKNVVQKVCCLHIASTELVGQELTKERYSGGL